MDQSGSSPLVSRSKTAATALLRALESATGKKGFSAASFFASWFPVQNTFLFLFKKNLGVTNMQYGELLALLQQHSKLVSAGDPPTLTFTSPNQFKETVAAVVRELTDYSATSDSASQLVVELYTPILESLVVVRPFYGSCVAHVPAHISLDLASLCGMSGYIHSCGPAVYARRIDKAKKREFFGALDHYLDACNSSGKRMVFAPYAHEDFSEFDKDRAHVREELRHGLEDVKLYVEKMNMGASRLVAVLEEMRKRYSDRLEIPAAGDYRVTQPSHARNTLWLIRDRAVRTDDLGVPGEASYLICYDQRYFNDSPFFIFDENKPAWLSHTTIPHTLAAAMINLTKPWLCDGALAFADPFMGTGTMLLEAAKNPRVNIFGGDKEEAAKIATGDNLEFFGLTVDGLSELDTFLSDLLSLLDESEDAPVPQTRELFPGPFPDPLTTYNWARNIIDKLRSGAPSLSKDLTLSQEILDLLKGESLAGKTIFYICLRAAIRHQPALYRGSKSWLEVFRASAKELWEELKDFRSWAIRARTAHERLDHLGIFTFKYSNRCAISADRLEELAAAWRSGSLSYKVRDACDLKPNSYDVIATDPPYGFNTDEEFTDLSRLYKRVLGTLVRALRERGHLVLSLPVVLPAETGLTE